jgi:hypothetical protein
MLPKREGKCRLVDLFVVFLWDAKEVTVTKAEIRIAEERIINKMKRIAHEAPFTAILDLDFKRDWAFGNVGLENDSITRQQVDQTIKE